MRIATAVLLIVLPIALNAGFIVLSSTFSYAAILKQPTGEVLARFRAGGASLVRLWWLLAMAAVLLVPLAVLTAGVFAEAEPAIVVGGLAAGILAALVQFLGLIRWPFLVPYLAREHAKAEAGSARAEAIDVVFQSSHRYLGIAVGEHLGYLFSGVWAVLLGIAVVQSGVLPWWLGAVGIVVGAVQALCFLEFAKPLEERAKPAGVYTPIVYTIWSVWLIAIGVALLIPGA